MPKQRAPPNTPSKPYTRGNRRAAVAESSQGGQAPASIPALERMETDENNETAANPAAGGGGSGGGAGGTMISGGMRSQSVIPAPLQMLEGPWLCQRAFRFQIPIIKQWDGGQIWQNATSYPQASRAAAVWFGPYFHLPKNVVGVYVNEFFATWLDTQQYWNIEHCGMKIDKVEFHRVNRVLPNATTPQIRVDSAWQPSMHVLDGPGVPQQFVLRRFSDKRIHQNYQEICNIWDDAAAERLPELNNVGFTMNTISKNIGDDETIPRFPLINKNIPNNETLRNWDFFHHKTRKYEMNIPGPVVEMKCMKGWRVGSIHGQAGMKCFDTNPPGSVQELNNGDPAPPNTVITANTYNHGNPGETNVKYTNRTPRSVNRSPSCRLSTAGVMDGDYSSNFRNDWDGFMPHMKAVNNQTFFRFARPPIVADDETEWYATIDISTEAVGQWSNCAPTEDEIFYPSTNTTDIMYSGDRRKVMQQMLYADQPNARNEAIIGYPFVPYGGNMQPNV